MNFKDKYTLDKAIKGDEDKIKLSTDYYAVCEMLDFILIKMELIRIK